MFRKAVLGTMILAGIPSVWGQAPAVIAPYTANYTLLPLGSITQFGIYFGSLTFQNASTMLISDYVEEGGSTIYQLGVLRAGPGGHINGFGIPCGIRRRSVSR